MSTIPYFVIKNIPDFATLFLTCKQNELPSVQRPQHWASWQNLQIWVPYFIPWLFIFPSCFGWDYFINKICLRLYFHQHLHLCPQKESLSLMLHLTSLQSVHHPRHFLLPVKYQDVTVINIINACLLKMNYHKW